MSAEDPFSETLRRLLAVVEDPTLSTTAQREQFSVLTQDLDDTEKGLALGFTRFGRRLGDEDCVRSLGRVNTQSADTRHQAVDGDQGPGVVRSTGTREVMDKNEGKEANKDKEELEAKLEAKLGLDAQRGSSTLKADEDSEVTEFSLFNFKRNKTRKGVLEGKGPSRTRFGIGLTIAIVVAGLGWWVYANHAGSDEQNPATDGEQAGPSTPAVAKSGVATTPVSDTPDRPHSRADDVGAGELPRMRQLTGLVDEGDYAGAVALFPKLKASHRSGVGFSAYPAAAFAFDQTGDEAGGLAVLDALEARLNRDETRGSGYLTFGRHPRGPMRVALRAFGGKAKSEKIRERAMQLAERLVASPQR